MGGGGGGLDVANNINGGKDNDHDVPGADYFVTQYFKRIIMLLRIIMIMMVLMILTST